MSRRLPNVHPKPAVELYDPNSEATNSEQVVAGHWECLRRNAEFRSLANRWLASEEFRFVHVLSADYHNAQYHTPRCALDWMLTPVQRVRLAKYQIEKFHWFFDPHFNFGPVICQQKFSPAAVTGKNLSKFLHVEPMRNAPVPISVDHSWGSVPKLFKNQFRAAYGSRGAFGEINTRFHELSKILRVAAGKLAAGDPLNEASLIADLMFAFGSELRELAEFSKIFKIPRMRYSEKQFALFLEQIRESFKRENLLLPTKTYDTHQSYQGTTEDWRWFLNAERFGLDVGKSVDARKLAELYSEDLRHRKMRGNAPRRAKVEGFSGSKFSSRVLKNRRSTVRRHILAIQKWIRSAYPKPDANLGAASV